MASLQAIKQPIFPMFLGIARQLVVPVSINYVLIVLFDFPMMTIFYTLIIVVVISAGIAHWYTLRQLNRIKPAVSDTWPEQGKAKQTTH